MSTDTHSHTVSLAPLDSAAPQQTTTQSNALEPNSCNQKEQPKRTKQTKKIKKQKNCGSISTKAISCLFFIVKYLEESQADPEDLKRVWFSLFSALWSMIFKTVAEWKSS